MRYYNLECQKCKAIKEQKWNNRQYDLFKSKQIRIYCDMCGNYDLQIVISDVNINVVGVFSK
jgi:Zn finger protein HypA/HybF involved in hydrogenase expression